MKQSAIGWTDFSGGDLNFVTGCTPVSEGCKNCYAKAIYKRFGRDFGVTVHPEKLERLWRTGFPEWSPKRGAGHRPMAFVCDTGDLFHPDVPEEFLEFVFHTMGHLSGVAWQVLTKRPERMRAFMQRFNFEDLPSDHIWLGVTAENQQRADERIPILLDTPASVRFVSCEPMLERIDIRRYLGYNTHKEANQDEQRRGTVRVGRVGRVGDRRTGTHLEDTLWGANARRASDTAGISSGKENERRHTPTYGGAQAGMSSCLWADSIRANGKPQERQEGRQSARESGDCELFRESQTCLQDGACLAMGRTKSIGKVEQQGRGDDTGDLREGRNNPARIGGALRSDLSDDLGHSAWTPTPTAGRANKRLREQAAASECATRRQGSLHLVICGAESGGNRRKFDVAWAVDLYEQCKDAGVAYFYKQGSALQPGQHDELPGLGVVHEWPCPRV